jgi:hypothetical protein
MPIKPLGHTLAANPRRKRRNPKRGAGGKFVSARKRANPRRAKYRNPKAASAKKSRRLSYGATTKRGGNARVGTLVVREITTKKGKRRTAAKIVRGGVKRGSSWQKAGGVYKRALRKKSQSAFYMTKNPSGLVFAGVEVVPAAIGAAAALVFGHAGNAAVSKWLKGKLGPLEPYAGPLVILGAAWAAQKYMRNPMVRSGAKYAAMAAVFMIVNEAINTPIKNAVGKAFDVTMTGWVDTWTGEPAMSGMYLSPALEAPAGFGGFADGMNGLGLFEGTPVYG